MGQLDQEYKSSKPDASENEFREQVFEPIKNFVKAIPQLSSILDDPLVLKQIAEFIAGDRERLEIDIAFIYLACIHAVAAAEALERSDHDLAWALMCEANFRIGYVFAINRGDEVTTKTMEDLYKKEIATKHGIKRHAKTNELKKQALDIVRSRTDWKSQGVAIRVVKSTLEKSSAAGVPRVSEETIKGWIKGMEDRSKFIQSLPDLMIKKD